MASVGRRFGSNGRGYGDCDSSEGTRELQRLEGYLKGGVRTMSDRDLQARVVNCHVQNAILGLCRL